MKVLPEMFKFICTSIEIHPQFLNLVFRFGRRNSSADDNLIAFYKSLSFKVYSDAHPTSYGESWSEIRRHFSVTDLNGEVSYNLQFFEPHGRQLADPWSCRQSAIYQKFLLSENRSAWVVIYQPLLFHDSLQDAQIGALTHPMSLHLRYIRSATHYWRDYLKYRSSELLSFVGDPLGILFDKSEYVLGRKTLYSEVIQ